MRFLVVLALLAVSVTSFAKSHGPSGCGLGSVLFKDSKGLVMNVLAATFNGTSGNQTFGMSTGTLGCEDAQGAKVAAVSFVEANTVALSNDIAKGNGEALGTYLTLIEKNGADTAVLKSNYGKIFAKGNTPAKIHEEISALL